MSRRAFTLVELLVVIGIMITLMSLIMGGVMLAKRSAQRAKAVSLLGTVASAIDQYRSLNNTYPERLIVTSDMVANYGFDSALKDKEVYESVFRPSGAGDPVNAEAVDKDAWTTVNRALVYLIGDLVREQAVSGLVADPWKMPLRYRPAKWYPYTSGTGVDRVDSDNPPGQDSYQLWSLGPNAKQADSPGEGDDDLPNWTKLP